MSGKHAYYLVQSFGSTRRGKGLSTGLKLFGFFCQEGRLCADGDKVYICLNRRGKADIFRGRSGWRNLDL